VPEDPECDPWDDRRALPARGGVVDPEWLEVAAALWAAATAAAAVVVTPDEKGLGMWVYVLMQEQGRGVWVCSVHTGLSIVAAAAAVGIEPASGGIAGAAAGLRTTRKDRMPLLLLLLLLLHRHHLHQRRARIAPQ
jgi:hypothetical protein